MKYDVIIFDLGRVVVDFDYNMPAEKIKRRFGLDKRKIHDLFFDSRITRLHDEGRLSSREFYDRVKKMLDIDMSFSEFKKCWNDIFFENKQVGKLVRRLKKIYKVYLLSNTNKLHFDFIKKKFSIIKQFDKLILSYKIGKIKPHPAIYKYALRLANCSPQGAIYIDDRPELVEGARRLGINTILFKNISALKKELRSLGVLIK